MNIASITRGNQIQDLTEGMEILESPTFSEAF
jgi:hypothetical protein